MNYLINKKKIHLIMFFLFFCLQFFACMNFKEPAIKFEQYTLDYDSPSFSSLNKLPVTIYVKQFQVSPVYSKNNIIYSEKKFLRASYPYKKWIASPEKLVTFFLARDFKNSALFNGVFLFNNRFKVNYLIDGVVEKFLEQDEALNWFAILSVNITLINAKEKNPIKKILFQKNYNISQLCKQKNPASVALAMSKAMSKLSKMVISDVYKHINEQ